MFTQKLGRNEGAIAKSWGTLADERTQRSRGRRRRRFAHHQFRFQIVFHSFAALQPDHFFQGLKRDSSQTFARYSDGRKRRARQKCEGDVVDANHGNVLRNSHARLLQRVHRSHGNEIAAAENYGGQLAGGENGADRRGACIDLVVAVDCGESSQAMFIQAR